MFEYSTYRDNGCNSRTYAVVRAFRHYLLNKGYDNVAIRKHFCAPYFVVVGYDSISDDYLFLLLDVDEMKAVTKSGNVFWRYVK
uniref:Uncharacterized protein n=2 Tax=unclassified Microvirus TaxID=338099 RepID=A0AAU8AUA0_9VIRU